MNRFSIMAFLIITLTAASIGAHSSFQFVAGKDTLKDRKRYCEFAKSVKKNPVLSTYREFKMSYRNLPEFLTLHLDDNESAFQTRLKQLEVSLQLLADQKQNLARAPASAVVDWKLKTEIPEQMTQLTFEKDRLDLKMQDLKQRNFSELEISNTYLEAREEAMSSDPLPLYGLELHLYSSLLGDYVELTPVWIEIREDNKWFTKAASERALLRVKRSMLTPEPRKAFAEKRMPSSFSEYETLAQTQGLSLNDTRWKFTSTKNLLIIGSPSSHLAAQAILDLSCLK